MRWSSLNATQRAFVQAGARFSRDVVTEGKLRRRGAAKSPKAEMLNTMRALDDDERRAKAREGRALMGEALSAFTPTEIERLATRLPAGRAYGSKELNRVRAGAMPMNYFRGTQYGC